MTALPAWRDPERIARAAETAASQGEVADLLGASGGSSVRAMKQVAAAHGIPLPRSSRAEFQRRRLASQTFDLFDMRTDEHAYLLGLLQTDGHLDGSVTGKGRLTLELAARDIELLERIQPLFPCHSSLTTRRRRTNFATDYQSATLAISNMEVRRELAQKGMPVGKKSATVSPPVDPDLNVRAYLRGLWDGDGSVGVTASGYPFVSFVSKSPVLAEFVLDHIEQVTTKRYRPSPNRRDGVTNISLFRHEAVEFGRWLYRPGDLAMARKALAASAFDSWVPTKRAPARKAWTPAEDHIAMTASVQEAAEALGRTIKSVAIRRYRLALRDGTPPAAR